MRQEDFVIGDVSLDGFQVVRGHYFSRILEPSMTIRATSLTFSIAAYNALNNCEAVQVLVNQESRRVLVRPISSSENDAVGWIKNLDSPKSKPIECSAFANQLYDVWEWDKKRRYRANGKLVKYDKKLMLMFDFTDPEIYEGMKLVREHA